MTKFAATNFNYHGGYLMYYPDGVGSADRRFVARFKYRGPFKMGVFKKELMKNHTVESYFSAMQDSAPLTILQDRNPQWYDTCIEKFKAKFA
jgi:hypothetical protein|tara:strand:+ start:764 stop:1039 length:276 start_codon:yes stop_codon:yes gene_type:complete